MVLRSEERRVGKECRRGGYAQERRSLTAPRDVRRDAQAGAPPIVPLRWRADSGTAARRWTSPWSLSRIKNIFYCSYISSGHFSELCIPPGCVWRDGGDSGRVAKPRACSSGSAAPPPLLSGPFLSSARITTLTLACHRRTRARGGCRGVLEAPGHSAGKRKRRVLSAPPVA